jgi:hypothetical protein
LILDAGGGSQICYCYLMNPLALAGPIVTSSAGETQWGSTTIRAGLVLKSTVTGAGFFDVFYNSFT